MQNLDTKVTDIRMDGQIDEKTDKWIDPNYIPLWPFSCAEDIKGFKLFFLISLQNHILCIPIRSTSVKCCNKYPYNDFMEK